MTDQEDEIAALKARIAELEGKSSTSPVPLVKVEPKSGSGFGKGFMGCLGVGAAILVVVAILAAIGSASNKSAVDANTDVGTIVPAPSDRTADVSEVVSSSGPWRYSSEIDPLTDGATRLACVTSRNTVSLDFPYGNRSVELCLRDSPQFGRDAFIRLQGSGQFLCDLFDGCTLQVRFDEAPASGFTAVEPSDSSTNILFIQNRSRLENGLKGATRTIIQAEFYQAGVQPIEFPTEGFEWPTDGDAPAQ